MYNNTVAWANSAPANTENTVDISSPSGEGMQLSLKNATVLGGSDGFSASVQVRAVRGRGIRIIIRNPSAVTAITCEVRNVWTDSAGTARKAKLTSFTAAVTATNAGGESFWIDDPLI